MRVKADRSVVPPKAGTHAKVLFQRLKWIPAFAGMTARGQFPPPSTRQVKRQQCQFAVLLDILSPGQLQ